MTPLVGGIDEAEGAVMLPTQMARTIHSLSTGAAMGDMMCCKDGPLLA